MWCFFMNDGVMGFFFTKPLAEGNTVPRTPPDAAQDPRLLVSEQDLRVARGKFLDASFQESAYRARHKNDLPVVLSDGHVTKIFAKINAMQLEDPKLRALCNQTQRTQEAFHAAQAALANLKMQLGLIR